MKHIPYDAYAEPNVLDEKTGSKQQIDCIFVRISDEEVMDILNYGLKITSNE
jgi:hypothetical protein